MKKLTEAQIEELRRFARGVEFNESIPEWRLVHSGFVRIETEEDGKKYAVLTEQGKAYLRCAP